MTQFEHQLITTASGNVSRPGLLGAAAVGASGIALMQAAAAAEAADQGRPGQGGYGRNCAASARRQGRRSCEREKAILGNKPIWHR
jgi:hypothetical protein